MSRYLRQHLSELVPYSSARQESGGAAGIWLDANESPYSSAYNRYPDPRAIALREVIAKHAGVECEQVLPACGSDQLIDMIFRAYCEPGQDTALTFSPGFSMYDHCAQMNDVEMYHMSLDDQYDIHLDRTLTFVRKHAPKIIFLCSPNNPTGNSLTVDRMVSVARAADGIVVIDEAYIHYADAPSLAAQLEDLPNVIILQTLSKAHGAAGLRLGYAMAATSLLDDLRKVKLPYDLSSMVSDTAVQIIKSTTQLHQQIAETISERKRLRTCLENLPEVVQIYPSDANFLLVRFLDHRKVYTQLRAAGIIVRDRSALVEACLRITVGVPKENDILLATLQAI